MQLVKIGGDDVFIKAQDQQVKLVTALTGCLIVVQDRAGLFKIYPGRLQPGGKQSPGPWDDQTNQASSRTNDLARLCSPESHS
jgi:hypothetical protein